MLNRLTRAAAAVAFTGIAQVCAAAPIYWTDWQGTTPGTGTVFNAYGAISTPTSTVSVSYSNPRGVGFFQTGAAGEADWWVQRPTNTRVPATSPYTSSQVDNIPTGTDMIGLANQGPQFLHFSKEIANPVFAFISLNANGYTFIDQDFDILSVGGVDGNDCGYWGCGGVTKVVTDLGNGHKQYSLNASNVGGLEPHGVIQFKGAFSMLQWNSASNEYWNGFTIGVQGTADEVFPNDVPEPASLALVGMALAGLGLVRRRRA